VISLQRLSGNFPSSVLLLPKTLSDRISLCLGDAFPMTEMPGLDEIHQTGLTKMPWREAWGVNRHIYP
jgi:hypothetical protein